jgi:nitroreductase
MIGENVLKDILARAVHAPSGDNAQPWEFEINDDQVFLFHTDADETLYNFRNRGTYVAHGALIENISLLASRKGFGNTIELFPNKERCTARIRFTAKETPAEPLADAIATRATNRRPYDGRPLEEKDSAALQQATAHSTAELHLVEDRKDVDVFAKAISLNERLLMENKELHDFLFGMIRWTPQDELSRSGLFVKTMELPPPVRLLFRYVLTHWPLMNALNMMGFPRVIAMQTAGLYATSSAFGLFTISGDSDSDFVLAGRVMQRVWLTAASRGLAIQPVAGIPYLAERIRSGEGRMFSAIHCASIRAADHVLRDLSGVSSSDHIAMIFRIGYASAPTARSGKRAPVMRNTRV